MTHSLPVLVDTPAHSPIATALTYRSELFLAPGTLVRVPLGKREVLGVVWDAPAPEAQPALGPDKLRPVTGALQGLAPLNQAWRSLVGFAARYYQRSAGEVALAALPPQLRGLDNLQLARRLKRYVQAPPFQGMCAPPDAITDAPTLTPEQQQVLAAFDRQRGPFLLFGTTGSGKTEVYLQCAQRLLARDAAAQVLILVPEINLTPQLEERVRARFGPLYGAHTVVSLHSGMSAAQRLQSWLAAHSGAARIVLGTRMAVFASMPRLQLIVVDEEHDPSYKQQEGARYSARDLALYRAQLEAAKIMLGSATPSLESWHHSRPAGGRYTRLSMPSRVGAHATLPVVRCVDMNHQPKGCVFSPPLLQAIVERIVRGEQSLIFLNRRGYAPVLFCTHCDWKSQCPHCSAYRVFHKTDRTLRCHHCGLTQAVPRACPSCGNPDIGVLGHGTEKLEEHLAQLLASVRRSPSADAAQPTNPKANQPLGEPVRIARIDADSTRLKGALASQLGRVHAGEVDVLVGTQMIAKGHDFRRITLVAAVHPDAALFSSDFRAPERLFSLLTQAAGRAGRTEGLGARSEMWLQTFYPQHPLFAALRQHDYPAFAEQQLEQRAQAAMPPFSFQALARAEARTQEVAQGFLTAASQACTTHPDCQEQLEHITLYPAVPMTLSRVANVERAQMLIESRSRARLQRFLSAWQAVLHRTRQQAAGQGLIRWAVDVDPLGI